MVSSSTSSGIVCCVSSSYLGKGSSKNGDINWKHSSSFGQSVSSFWIACSDANLANAESIIWGPGPSACVGDGQIGRSTKYQTVELGEFSLDSVHVSISIGSDDQILDRVPVMFKGRVLVLYQLYP